MGDCCCKDTSPDELVYIPSPARPSTVLVTDPHMRVPKVVDPKLVDQLIIEILRVAATRVDSEDVTSPACFIKLHVIADIEEGWIQIVTSMVNVIPLEDPFSPTAISILLDECPLPSKETVTKVTNLFGLSAQRASVGECSVRVERNICVTLGCIADKLVGPNSVAILTENVLDYLLTYLSPNHESCIVLFALIAVEKFAKTTENKLSIKGRLDRFDQHPLLTLENLANSADCIWRQVGFCAKWALDNLFIIEGRSLSYETVDMTGINAILNPQDVTEYLHISCNGLEARSDSYSFESVRCTFQVDSGCWYYESMIVTPGVMQIGWATRNSHFLNDEGFGIGDDLYSLSYDGCRRLVWYKARPTAVPNMPAWRPGDVLGCLIDLDAKEMIFSLNGQRFAPCREIFTSTRYGFFAAASFMAYQQCRFNFGCDPFKYPPMDRPYSVFNDYGKLTKDQKVIPKRLYLEQLRSFIVQEDSCTICFDDVASYILEPCGHRGFCSVCTSQLKDCPMCRADILNVKREDA